MIYMIFFSEKIKILMKKKKIISTNCETYCNRIIKNDHSLFFDLLCSPTAKVFVKQKVNYVGQVCYKLQYPAQLHLHLHKVDVDNRNLPNKSTIIDEHNNLIWVTVITSWLPISEMFGREKHVLMEKNPDYGGDTDILKSTWHWQHWLCWKWR